MEEDKGSAPFFRDDDDGDSDLVAKTVMEHLAAEHADPIVPKPPIHHTSQGFANPVYFVCIGVSPQRALAWRGPADTLKSLRELWVQQERVGVYASRLRYFEAYKGQWSRDKLESELAQLEIIAAVDLTLQQPMKRLIVKLKEMLIAAAKETQRTEDFTKIPIMKRKNPAGKVECATEDLPEPAVATPPPSPSLSEWSIHVCPVPRKAARRTPPGWKPLEGLDLSHIRPGTAPVACFNDTHLVLLYSGATDQITVECGTITTNQNNGKPIYSRQWIRQLPVPANVADFSAVARLSPAGTLTVALCNMIYVIPTSDPSRVLVMRMQPHVMVTALWFCDASGGLTWGTQCGESFYCNANSLDDMQTLLTPLEEPVLSVQRDAANGGRWMVSTWMSVVGRLAPGALSFKALPMERPLAIAARGALLFVLTKYGKLDVYRPGMDDSPLRGLLKVKKGPFMETQYAYDGLVTVGEKGLAALMPSGQVHYFEWE